MIVNFYEIVGVCDYKFIISKYLTVLPPANTGIRISGNMFYINSIDFDVDKCEYSFYLYKM